MNARSSRRSFKAVRRAAVSGTFTAAAEAVIARKGYAGTTMHDIAREAGCASGTLYLYFKNKEDLFNAIVAHHSGVIAQLLREAMATTDQPVEKLRRSTAAYLDYFHAHLAFFRIFYTSEPGGTAPLTTSLRDKALKDYLEYRRLELKILKQAQADKLVRTDIAAAELLEFMHDLAMATSARWSLNPNLPSPETQFQLLWGFMTGGLGVRGGGP